MPSTLSDPTQILASFIQSESLGLKTVIPKDLFENKSVAPIETKSAIDMLLRILRIGILTPKVLINHEWISTVISEAVPI